MGEPCPVSLSPPRRKRQRESAAMPKRKTKDRPGKSKTGCFTRKEAAKRIGGRPLRLFRQSATGSVEATRRTAGRLAFQACNFWIQSDAAILQYKTRHPYIPFLSGFRENRTAVAQAQKLLQTPYMFPDVDNLIPIVALHLRLHKGTIWTTLHAIDLYHTLRNINGGCTSCPYQR